MGLYNDIDQKVHNFGDLNRAAYSKKAEEDYFEKNNKIVFGLQVLVQRIERRRLDEIVYYKFLCSVIVF